VSDTQVGMADGKRSRAQTHLWVVQRVTAMMLGVAVAVHLVTIVTAVRGGLSAREILDRTQGNEAWLAFRAARRDRAAQHRRRDDRAARPRR
jgi:fumarate reductase subunit C